MTKSDSRSGVVIFDGVCNLCNGALTFIAQHDSASRFLFTPSQGDLAQRLLRQYRIQESLDETFVLIQEGRCYFRSDAAMRIAAQLDGSWRFLAILRFVPSGLRDSLYQVLARNRYRWFGKRDSCMIPTTETAQRLIS